jgi:ComF family protein
MMRLKFSGWRGAAVPFVPSLADVLRDAPLRTIRPVLTWVPLGRRRKHTRGFDQAQAIARVLTQQTGWPAERLLRRDRETDPQARRGASDRRTALAGAFSARARPPPVVVVVDDVLTTGATAAACAEVLVEAGARTVGLVTLARALGGPLPDRACAVRGAAERPA